MSKIEIVGGRRGRTQIRVDGNDIAGAVRGLTLTMGPGADLPTLHLDIAYIEIERLELEEAKVLLPTATFDLLVRFGWTPPEGQTDAAKAE